MFLQMNCRQAASVGQACPSIDKNVQTPLAAFNVGIAVAAAMELEANGRWNGIESLWRTKAGLVRRHRCDVAGQQA